MVLDPPQIWPHRGRGSTCAAFELIPLRRRYTFLSAFIDGNVSSVQCNCIAFVTYIFFKYETLLGTYSHLQSCPFPFPLFEESHFDRNFMHFEQVFGQQPL